MAEEQPVAEQQAPAPFSTNPFYTSLVEDLSSQLGGMVWGFEETYGLLNVHTSPQHVLQVIQYLHDHETWAMRFLTDLCAVHYPDHQGQELQVVYLLHNLPANQRLRVKVGLPIADPVIPTLSELFSSANWMERETYDFYGVLFTGHPNLKRILNVDDMDYFPMRKEYPLEDPTRRDKHDEMFGR